MHTRTTMMGALAGATLMLGGCSQLTKGYWVKSDTPAQSIAQSDTLRTTPTQSYDFAGEAYEVELYADATDYSGYAVELYDTTPTMSDPREAAFVKLNGNSEASDWRNCETRHRGYLFISEYDFRLDPEFEVCMRNKGYVLSTEAGSFATNPINAQTAGLRGYAASGYGTPITYTYP